MVVATVKTQPHCSAAPPEISRMDRGTCRPWPRPDHRLLRVLSGSGGWATNEPAAQARTWQRGITRHFPHREPTTYGVSVRAPQNGPIGVARALGRAQYPRARPMALCPQVPFERRARSAMPTKRVTRLGGKGSPPMAYTPGRHGFFRPHRPTGRACGGVSAAVD
jgi:hypothetical protein